MVNSGRTQRYVIYAIGEIMLVVIGILMALQVNNWREQVLLKEREIETIQSLLRDLKSEESQQKWFFRRLSRQEDHIISFMKAIDRGGVHPDTLAKLAGNAVELYNYRPSFPTFAGLKQSGGLNLIQDRAIREKIIGYHDFDIPYLDDLRDTYRRISNERAKYLRLYFGYWPNDEGEWNFRAASDLSGLQSDNELMHILGANGRHRAWLKFRLEEIFIPSNQTLQKELEEYLVSLQ